MADRHCEGEPTRYRQEIERIIEQLRAFRLRIQRAEVRFRMRPDANGRLEEIHI